MSTHYVDLVSALFRTHLHDVGLVNTLFPQCLGHVDGKLGALSVHDDDVGELALDRRKTGDQSGYRRIEGGGTYILGAVREVQEQMPLLMCHTTSLTPHHANHGHPCHSPVIALAAAFPALHPPAPTATPRCSPVRANRSSPLFSACLSKKESAAESGSAAT